MSATFTWLVSGTRWLPNGNIVSLTGASWGATEGHARKVFQRLQALGPKADVFGHPYYQWADADLVFTAQLAPPKGGSQ